MRSALLVVGLLLVAGGAGCLAAFDPLEDPPAPEGSVDAWTLNATYPESGVTTYRRSIAPQYRDNVWAAGRLTVGIEAERTGAEFILAELYLEADGKVFMPLQLRNMLGISQHGRATVRHGGEPTDPIPLPLHEVDGYFENRGRASGEDFQMPLFFYPDGTFNLVLVVAHVASNREHPPSLEMTLTLDAPRLSPHTNVTTVANAAGVISLREGRGFEGTDNGVDIGPIGASRTDRARAGFQLKNHTLVLGVLAAYNVTFDRTPAGPVPPARLGTATLAVSNGVKTLDYGVGHGHRADLAVFISHTPRADRWQFELSGTGALEFVVFYCEFPVFEPPAMLRGRGA